MVVSERLRLLLVGHGPSARRAADGDDWANSRHRTAQERDPDELRPRARRFSDTARIKAYIWIDAGFASEHGGKKGLKSPEALAHMALQPDLYFISMAARLLDMHPQTLRKYERLGLVSPTRTVGSMRVYTSDELERLRLIKHLVEDVGVNLAGVQRLLSIAEAVQRLRPLIREDGSRSEARKRMAQEIERIGEMVGL